MKCHSYLLSLIVALTQLFCNSTGPADENTSTKTKSKFSLGTEVSSTAKLKVELIGTDSILKEGYDSLVVRFLDNITGNVITNLTVSLYPIMDMGAMQHSAPVDSFTDKPGADSSFRSGVLFVIPSDSSLINGGWTVRVRIHDNRFASTAQYNDSVDFPVWVQNDSTVIRWKGLDSLSRVAALIQPRKPQEGSNVLELFVAKRENGFSWPVDSSWNVTFVPTMPSMGHSSPNNINPVYIGGGHFKGKVNFTMTGLWKLSFKFRPVGSAAVVDSSQYINIDF